MGGDWQGPVLSRLIGLGSNEHHFLYYYHVLVLKMYVNINWEYNSIFEFSPHWDIAFYRPFSNLVYKSNLSNKFWFRYTMFSNNGLTLFICMNFFNLVRVK